MGIFFDQEWFDARLRAAGLSRGSMAQAAGMTFDEVEMVFADRRELDASEIQAIARILAVEPQEVALRSGLAEPDERSSGILSEAPSAFRSPGSAPGAGPGMSREVIAGLHERLDRLERMLEVVLQKLSPP